MAKKTVTKRKLKKQKRFLIFIIIILLVLDITLLIKYITKGEEKTPEPEVIHILAKYDNSKMYYSQLTYADFKKLYKSNKLSYIAITDKASGTYGEYIELINRYSFNNNRKIYLLEKNKLSTNDLKSFYEIDERLEQLETNYFILVKDSKIITITEFKDETLNVIIQSLEIEE